MLPADAPPDFGFNEACWCPPTKQNEQPYWCDPVPTRYRAPVSATVRATKFPCIEYVFYFVEGKAVMPYRLWYVYISVKSEAKTLILESEK
jgi:hypothetical protein